MIKYKKTTMCKRLFFLGFLLFFSALLPAQDLHIFCDAFSDSVYYMRNNRPVEDARVRKGDQIVLHVKNYNSYLYNIELETDKTNLTLSQGQFGKGFSAVSGGGNPFEMLLKSVGGIFPSLPNLGGGVLDDVHGFATTAEEEAAVRKIKKIELELNRNLSGMQQTSEELKSLELTIKTELNAQKLTVFSIEEINRLRYDPNLEPAQIKRLTREYAQQVFKESDPNKLTLEYLAQRQSADAPLEKLVSDYHKKVGRYARFQEKTADLSEELLQFSIPKSNLSTFVDSTTLAAETAHETLEDYQKNLHKLEAGMEGAYNMDASKMAELRSSYISFMANDFSRTYRQVASGDNLTLKVRIEPIDSATYLGAHSKRLPPIPVKVYGGIRVTTSVGIGFAKFFENPKDYFVRDSIVYASDKDAFSPVLSTFIHFYSPKPGTISWGGSFGVGIPLGGDNNLQSISFFLGPSIVIGQDHNIVFTAGLSGGKVPKPAQGYAVGDRFESDAALFTTESKYALGYFLGVSFNIIGK